MTHQPQRSAWRNAISGPYRWLVVASPLLLAALASYLAFGYETSGARTLLRFLLWSAALTIIFGSTLYRNPASLRDDSDADR